MNRAPRSSLRALALLALAAPLAACPGDDPEPEPEVADVFGQRLGDPVPYATEEQLATFERGHAVALRRFSPEEGLGPIVNVSFCGSCHERPVIGGAAPRYRDFYLNGTALADGSFQKNPALLQVDEVNGHQAHNQPDRVRFEDLTPVFPAERLTLELSEDLTDEAARHVARLEGLRALDLLDLVACADALTDVGADALAGLRRLESLALWGGGLTDAALSSLASLAQLRRLELWAARGLGDRGLSTATRLRSLERLSLRGGPAITEAGLAALRAHPRLTSLRLDGIRLTPAGAAHIAAAPGLTSLALEDTGLDDRGAAALGRMPGLLYLSLASSSSLTDADQDRVIELVRQVLDQP